jgi:hypothetical protein
LEAISSLLQDIAQIVNAAHIAAVERRLKFTLFSFVLFFAHKDRKFVLHLLLIFIF